MKNIGGIDKILRIALGLILISLVFIGPATVWGWLGVIPLVTGLFGLCPLYSIFGINSCSVNSK